MGLFDDIKKVGKKVYGGVKKVINGVAKQVKKAVNVVKKIQKKTFKGIKELTRNKYVRLGLMITAAVMLPGAISLLPAIKGLGVTAAAVATGAISGAVIGAGGVVMAGGSFKDALKAGAFGAATGAAFAGIGEKIKQARALKEAEGAMAGDVFGGELAASGEKITIGTPSDAVSTTGDVALGTGEINTAVTSPTDVSAAIADSGLPAKPVGNLTDMSPLGSPDTIVMDEVGTAFAKTGDGLKPISSLNNYTLPELNIDTSGITDFTADISVDSLTSPDSLGISSTVKVSPTLKQEIALSKNFNIDPKVSFGEQLANRIKDSFSADNVVDGVFDFGTGMLGSAAEGFISDKLSDDPIQSGIPATAQQYGAGMSSQALQFPALPAGIDPIAPYQTLTYGSGDINAAGGELLRQQILPIQVA